MSRTIKQQPELRHVIFHLALAIECLGRGHRKAALYELEQIWGLIGFHGDDEEFYQFCERGWLNDGRQKEEKEVPLGKRRRVSRSGGK